jgi:acetaldehyde dehydrogenase (acetylating)
MKSQEEHDMEFDKDLLARQEARELARAAENAQRELRTFSQERIDAIVQAMAKAFCDASVELAELAVQETGFGNVEHKTTKNRFAARRVAQAVEGMNTVGVLKRHEKEKLWEVAVPKGVICAIVPSTNPTSTVCYKAIIALKAGNTIVFSPHPKALQCTLRAVQVVAQAAQQAGAPRGSIGVLTKASMAGCQELMAAREVNLILATGGPAMVRAAYSSGKPAIGVGAGNGPAYIHRSADISQALKRIKCSKCFDYGTICASEQSIIVEKSMESQVLEEAKRQGYYLMNDQQAQRLAELLFHPGGALNPQVVGKKATVLAEMAGFSVPRDTEILMARERQAGTDRPYSREKLCPVLAFFVEENEAAVLRRVIEVLTLEGGGHTFCMHCDDQMAVEKFALQVPVSRFVVNAPAAQGGIGECSGLFPALTLGCGSAGGSSSSNNISPMDLMDIRYVAWGSQESQPQTPKMDDALVEKITAMILEKLK